MSDCVEGKGGGSSYLAGGSVNTPPLTMKSPGSTPVGTVRNPVKMRWRVNSTEFLAAAASESLRVLRDRLNSFPW